MLKERFRKVIKENSQLSDDSINLLSDILVDETVRHLVEQLTEITVEKIIKEEEVEAS
jgi:hypothetical protein